MSALKKINKLLKLSGFRIIKDKDFFVDLNQIFSNGKNYTLHEYVKKDGSFDYDKYKTIQEEGNKSKLHQTWAVEENIKFVAEKLNKDVSPVKFGLCHGTRRGDEQKWFKKHIKDDVKVIGTEISETASSFPDTIQWDFHETKDEWLNAVDFIYSNSFDHSYDPEKCLNAWMGCIRPGGYCILEHTDHHDSENSRELDPFGANLMQMPLLISKWGHGKYGVSEIMKGPSTSGAAGYVAYIFIEKY